MYDCWRYRSMCGRFFSHNWIKCIYIYLILTKSSCLKRYSNTFTAVMHVWLTRLKQNGKTYMHFTVLLSNTQKLFHPLKHLRNGVYPQCLYVERARWESSISNYGSTALHLCLQIIREPTIALTAQYLVKALALGVENPSNFSPGTNFLWTFPPEPMISTIIWQL